MTNQDILSRKQIETALKLFSSGNFSQSSLALFVAPVYNTSRQNPFIKKTTLEFEDTFGHAQPESIWLIGSAVAAEHFG